MTDEAKIRQVVFSELDEYFERIDRRMGGVAPSEVRDVLEHYLSLGGSWEDWWRESGDEWH